MCTAKHTCPDHPTILKRKYIPSKPAPRINAIALTEEEADEASFDQEVQTLVSRSKVTPPNDVDLEAEVEEEEDMLLFIGS